MIGFDNYMPSKWLDSIFAIHLVGHNKKITTTLVRRGRWASVGAALVVAAAAGVATTSIIPLSNIASALSGTISSDQSNPEPQLAPIGYIEKLLAAIELAPKLAAQSLEFDPPALV